MSRPLISFEVEFITRKQSITRLFLGKKATEICGELLFKTLLLTSSASMEKNLRMSKRCGPSRLEDIFESSLYNCRFLVIFAVGGTMIAAAILFLKGTVEIIQGVNGFFRHVDFAGSTVNDDKSVILAFIPAIDNYLFATVLLIFQHGHLRTFRQ